MQVTVWEGALVVPEKSGSQRAVAIMADTIVIGMPSTVLESFDTVPVADELRNKSDTEILGLPPVRTMLAESADTLARHQLVTAVQRDKSSDGVRGDVSPSTCSAQQAGMDGVVNSGARVVRQWFREKINRAMDAVSSIANRGDDSGVNDDGAEDDRDDNIALPARECRSLETGAAATQPATVPAIPAGPGPGRSASAAPPPAREAAANLVSTSPAVDVQPPLQRDSVEAPAVLASGVVTQPAVSPRAVDAEGAAQQMDAVDPESHADGAAPADTQDGAPAEAWQEIRGAGYVPMQTGVGDISAPMLSFVASGYQVSNLALNPLLVPPCAAVMNDLSCMCTLLPCSKGSAEELRSDGPGVCGKCSDGL